jgi:UDP-N-acetylglucosamine 1-carboxyvinyltransferase
LKGTVVPSGNKNAAFPLISAALLTDQPVVLRNLPDIGDVRTMLAIVRDLGVETTYCDTHTVTLCAGCVRKLMPDPSLFSHVRGALVLMGSLLAREGRVELPQPGGDQIGRRRIDTHLLALRQLGASISCDDHVSLDVQQLRAADILLDEASVTATENTILAAATAQGKTIIRNAACEPHVQELCVMLNQMGARIEGIGSNVLTIEGVPRLSGVDYTLGADYIEVGSYIVLAAVTGSEVLIQNASPEHLRMITLALEKLGIRPAVRGKDVWVPASQSLKVVPDLGDAIPKVDDAPWPGFPADMMSVSIVAATQSTGTVLFHEKLFESRLFFIDRLIGMGAHVVLCDPHRCIVQGPARLHAEGQGIASPDIRAGMALLIAALCAQGTSTIRNIGQIDRGYECVEEKLQALGAKIKRVKA